MQLIKKKIPNFLKRKGNQLNRDEEEALQSLFGEASLTLQDGATFGRELAQEMDLVPKYATKLWLYPDHAEPITVRLNNNIEITLGLQHMSDRYTDVRWQVVETFSIFAHPFVEYILETLPLAPTAIGVELLKVSPDIVAKVAEVVKSDDVPVAGSSPSVEVETVGEAIQEFEDFCKANSNVDAVTQMVRGALSETNLLPLNTLEVIAPAIEPSLQDEYRKLIKNIYTAEINQLSDTADAENLVTQFGYLVGGVVALEANHNARAVVAEQQPNSLPKLSLKFEAKISASLKKVQSKLGKAILEQYLGTEPTFPNGNIEDVLKYYGLDDEEEIDRYLKDVKKIPVIMLKSKWLVQLSDEDESERANETQQALGTGNVKSAAESGAAGLASTDAGGTEEETEMRQATHGYTEPDPFQAVVNTDDGNNQLKDPKGIFDFEASYVTRDESEEAMRYIQEQAKRLYSVKDSVRFENIYNNDGGKEVYEEFKKYCSDPRVRYRAIDSGKRVSANSLALHKYDPSLNIFRKKTLEGDVQKEMNIILDMSGSMSGKASTHMRGILSGLHKLASEGYINGKVMLSLPYGTLAIHLDKLTREVVGAIQPSYGTEGLRDTVTEALPALKEGFNLVITDGCLTDAPIDDIVSQYNLSLHGSYIAEKFENNLDGILQLEKKLTKWFPYNTVRASVQQWAKDIAPVLVRAKVLR